MALAATHMPPRARFGPAQLVNELIQTLHEFYTLPNADITPAFSSTTQSGLEPQPPLQTPHVESLNPCTAPKRRDFQSHWAQQMLGVYQSQTESISVSQKQIRGGLVKEDGEAMSADTHGAPHGAGGGRGSHTGTCGLATRMADGDGKHIKWGRGSGFTRC